MFFFIQMSHNHIGVIFPYKQVNLPLIVLKFNFTCTHIFRTAKTSLHNIKRLDGTRIQLRHAVYNMLLELSEVSCSWKKLLIKTLNKIMVVLKSTNLYTFHDPSSKVTPNSAPQSVLFEKLDRTNRSFLLGSNVSTFLSLYNPDLVHK
ncbi:hypothetical protein HanRHA438_Chr15g0711491 [Helianthus annuus]|nr:hypothetical protein HanRHA438_Chr15g0711491 [Helianthus annuus]